MNEIKIKNTAYLETMNRILAANGKVVAFTYSILWFVLSSLAGYFNGAYAAEAWFILVAGFLFAVCRAWHITRINIDPPVVWRTWFMFMALLNAAGWAVVSVYILLNELDADVIIACLMITAGLVAGGIAYMSVLPVLAISYQTILLLPVGLFFWHAEEGGISAAAVLVLIFWLQMAVVTRQQSINLHERISNQLKLETYAEQLKIMGERDALTGLANRGFFEHSFEVEWKRQSRNGCGLSLLMVDIDYFKAVNDTYGHMVGDECLKQVSGIMSEVVKRPSDLIARFGGEEFIILLPDTDLKGAQLVAEKLRKKVEERLFLIDGQEIHITLSAGVGTESPTMSADRFQLLKRVDNALYKAKEMGRNRVMNVTP